MLTIGKLALSHVGVRQLRHGKGDRCKTQYYKARDLGRKCQSRCQHGSEHTQPSSLRLAGLLWRCESESAVITVRRF